MFQFRAVPFPCPYQPDLCCPVSVVLSERDPDRRCLVEALPCHRCLHYLARAQTLLAHRYVRLGPLGRQILTLAREHSGQCYPLTAVLRTDLLQRVDLRRVYKAVQSWSRCVPSVPSAYLRCCLGLTIRSSWPSGKRSGCRSPRSER